MVASVSKARSGATSMDTRPSTPSVASWVSLSTSAALRTSVVVSANTVLSTSAPASASSRTCASYRSPSLSAAAKIEGLVVTPTTELFLIRSARLPVSIRSRDRSSSQIETPASDRALRRSDILTSTAGRSGRSVVRPRGWPGQAPAAAMLSSAAAATAAAVTPYSA